MLLIIAKIAPSSLQYKSKLATLERAINLFRGIFSESHKQEYYLDVVGAINVLGRT